jgi:hypothetical protein
MGYYKQISVARWHDCAGDEVHEHRICQEGLNGCLTEDFAWTNFKETVVLRSMKMEPWELAVPSCSRACAFVVWVSMNVMTHGVTHTVTWLSIVCDRDRDCDRDRPERFPTLDHSETAETMAETVQKVRTRMALSGHKRQREGAACGAGARINAGADGLPDSWVKSKQADFVELGSFNFSWIVGLGQDASSLTSLVNIM